MKTWKLLPDTEVGYFTTKSSLCKVGAPTQAVVPIGAGVLLGLPFAGALCYEFLELTDPAARLPARWRWHRCFGASVMLRVSLTA